MRVTLSHLGASEGVRTPVRALLTGILLVAVASCRIWLHSVELAPPTGPEEEKASRTGLSADCVPQAPPRLTHLVSSQ